MQGYADIIPNGAERVMAMAENQSNHRMRLEDRALDAQIRQSGIGQVLAFIIGVVALSGSVYTMVNGYEWGGAILGAGGITGLVTAFIQGKSSQEKNLKSKKPE